MRTIISSTEHNGYQLSSAKNDQGHYRKILDSIVSLFDHMTQKHNNLFVVNFVVKYPQAFIIPDDNRLFLDFLEVFSLYCRRRSYDPKYLWVKERSLRTGQFHYHVLYLLDSNYIQNAYGILKKAIQLWADRLNIPDAHGLISLCTFNDPLCQYGGLKLKKSDPDYHQLHSAAISRASYLAKAHSKGFTSPHVNEFGMSRLC